MIICSICHMQDAEGATRADGWIRATFVSICPLCAYTRPDECQQALTVATLAATVAVIDALAQAVKP